MFNVIKAQNVNNNSTQLVLRACCGDHCEEFQRPEEVIKLLKLYK
uniref:Uncharacterized protein n=1 Tax=Meloidogyne hapla TaxID=6305 RepID=A0A1I8BGD1_MELHA